jgi:hypothetical protein
MTRIFWDPRFLWSDTPSHVFKHITIFGHESRLDDRELFIFIFEQQNRIWSTLYKYFSLHLNILKTILIMQLTF